MRSTPSGSVCNSLLLFNKEMNLGLGISFGVRLEVPVSMYQPVFALIKRQMGRELVAGGLIA